MVEAPSMIGQ
uniref:SCO1 protein n=1 Tax=Arundo donax TaxID=35708 RepID=A0A0A9AB27_ARUDO